MHSGNNNNANFIPGVEGDPSSPFTQGGLMLSDCWRYAKARPVITGYAGGTFTITENHIY